MIEFGEYVRTDKGYIVKIDKEKKNLQMLKFLDVEYGNILKHSKNIIDLIEVKDIIKYRVKVSTTLETKGYIEGIVDIADNEHLKAIKEDKNYEVLQILTYEQFNQNVYIVKEEQ